MPVRAGQITIDVAASTAKMVVDLEAAKGKLREFGAAGQGSARIVNAEMRVLEGNITNNVRAAGAFALMLPGLGKAAAAAFPIIGAVAFAGILGEIIVKARDYFKEVANAPEKIKGTFGDLTAGIRLSNDALQVANDKLDNDISKLEGKRQNTLKEALDEAKQAADELASSLTKDITAIDELLRKQPNRFLAGLSGKAGTEDIAKELGGETGFGGFRAKVAGTTNPTRLRALYDEELRIFKTAVIQAEAFQKDHSGGGLFGINGEAIHGHVEDRLEVLRQTLADLQQQSDAIDLKSANTAKQKKDDALKAATEYAKSGSAFTRWQKESDAQLESLKLKLDGIGKSEAFQVQQKAAGEALKEIAKLTGELDKNQRSLNEKQKQQVRDRATAEAQTEADIEWRTKLTAGTTAIEDRVKSQLALTAAIGAGYEATKQANVETRLAQELGQHANDPAWLRSHATDVAALRSGFGREFDAQHGDQAARTLQGLNDQIALERDLARVVSEGAEAIRLATLAQKAAQIARDNDAESARKLIAAETALSEAARDRARAKVSDTINTEIEATDRLTAATLRGADALRRARLENELAKIRQDQGDSGALVPGAIGLTQAELDAANKAKSGYKLELAGVAAGADPLKRIDDEAKKLQDAKALLGDTLAIEIKLRDLENERVLAMAQETLQLRTASAGFKAFFLEMQTQAKSAAAIIDETLNSVLDRSSDNFAKLLTEKHKRGDHAVSKAFGSEFTDIGREALGSSIKSTLHTALGKLGGAFGIHGKADGSSPNSALWVQLIHKAGLPFGPKNPGNGDFGGEVTGDNDNGSSSPLGGLFGKVFGSGGLGLIKSIFGGGLAGGGDAYPGQIYRVAEAGEGEFITPKNASTVTPASKLRSGDVHNHFTIDARGADIGVEHRIRRAIEAAHDSAAASAVRAQHEKTKRTPQRRT